jgi:hypothetical protein
MNDNAISEALDAIKKIEAATDGCTPLAKAVALGSLLMTLANAEADKETVDALVLTCSRLFVVLASKDPRAGAIDPILRVLDGGKP